MERVANCSREIERVSCTIVQNASQRMVNDTRPMHLRIQGDLRVIIPHIGCIGKVNHIDILANMQTLLKIQNAVLLQISLHDVQRRGRKRLQLSTSVIHQIGVIARDRNHTRIIHSQLQENQKTGHQ